MPTRPSPSRSSSLITRLAPWAVFAVAAVIVLAATSAWSSSLRGPETPTVPASSLALPVVPPRPASAPVAAPVDEPQAPAEVKVVAPRPTVVRASVPVAPPVVPPPPAPPVVVAPPPPPPPPVVEEEKPAAQDPKDDGKDETDNAAEEDNVNPLCNNLPAGAPVPKACQDKKDDTTKAPTADNPTGQTGQTGGN